MEQTAAKIRRLVLLHTLCSPYLARMTTTEPLESFFVRLRHSDIMTDGAHSGTENMQRDQAMADALIAAPSDRRVLVRFYWWTPWCISLGNKQPESDIAHERVRTDGIELVRRPTGGRAILHAAELTYALALRLDDRLTHGQVYHAWHQWLAHVLASQLGITDLTVARAQPDFPILFQREPTRWLCFASSARSELVWRGRKLVGSAQRLYGDVLLQHGSLLLGSGHQRLPFYLRGCSNPAELAAYLARRSVTLEEICGRPIAADTLSAILAEALYTASRC